MSISAGSVRRTSSSGSAVMRNQESVTFAFEKGMRFSPKGGTLIVFAAQEGHLFEKGLPTVVHKALEMELKRARDEQFKGKVGEAHLRHPTGAIAAARLIFAGVGKREELTADRLRRASGAAAKRARDVNAVRVHVVLPAADEKRGLDASAICQAVAEGICLGVYRFAGHKKPEDKPGQLTQCTLVHDFAVPAVPEASIRAAVRRGSICGDAVALTRDLTNEPANLMTPTILAQAAKKVARRHGLGIKVFFRRQIERLGMGALFGVSRGSVESPTFSILTYRPPRKAGAAAARGKAKTRQGFKRVAIVGKGLTFDSGGISLKPADGMQHMKNDMAGAAAVIAAMGAIAQLKPDVEVLGIVPATENLPSGTATKPGDVLRAFSGKTIEVTNTDAEGRLVLADAVAYAEKLGAEAIVDTATLTGAASVALGGEVTALLGNDQPLVDSVKAAATAAGEKVWQLPLVEEYKEMLKSESADIKNTDMKSTAGTIKGALFVAAFVDKAKWAHLDIAATAFTDKEHHLGPAGSTGVITRTLVEWVMSLA